LQAAIAKVGAGIWRSLGAACPRMPAFPAQCMEFKWSGNCTLVAKNGPLH